MAVHFRNGFWIVDYFPDGRYGRRLRTPLPEGTTEEEARTIDKRLRETALKSRTGKMAQAKPANITVSNLFETYIEWYRMHRSPKTCYDIKSVFRCHIAPILGKEIADKIYQDHVLLYKQMRLAERGSNNAINKELAYLSGFLKWAAKNQYITPRDIRMEKLPYKRPLPVVLSFEEVMAILNAAEPFYRTFFLCLYSLGLRLSEALNLKWEDVDFENDSVRMRQKGGGYKRLPMGPLLKEHLTMIPRYPDVAYVFWNPKTKTPLRDPRGAIARAVKAAGVTKRVTPHLFRHSMATHLVGKKINLRVIQEILGHASIETTEFYTHVALEHLRDASNQLWSTDKDGN